MEEELYDDEGPYFIVNYKCCGKVQKDEIPFHCGKKENGYHEIDEKIGIMSNLEIKKTKPGQIKQIQQELME